MADMPLLDGIELWAKVDDASRGKAGAVGGNMLTEVRRDDASAELVHAVETRLQPWSACMPIN